MAVVDFEFISWSSTRTGGFNREAGGSTRRRRTVGHRGDQLVRRAGWVDPDGLHAGGRHRGVLDAQLYLSS